MEGDDVFYELFSWILSLERALEASKAVNFARVISDKGLSKGHTTPHSTLTQKGLSDSINFFRTKSLILSSHVAIRNKKAIFLRSPLFHVIIKSGRPIKNAARIYAEGVI